MTKDDTQQDATPASELNRDEAAAKIVDRCSLWSGGAGLIPLPMIDVAAIGAVQLHMLRQLTGIYNVRFSENLGKSVLATLIGSVIPVTSGMGLASAMKSLPIVGTAVAMVSMPALSAGATYVIGRVFMQHFSSGGTLLDFNPPDYREFIKEQADRLKSKIDAPYESRNTPAATDATQDKAAVNAGR